MRDRPTVLVVEDDGAVRRFITLTLESNGFRVIACAAAAACLEILQTDAGSIDLAIIDMVMPQVSGLDLAAELGRRDPELKILYISGHAASIAICGLIRHAPHLVLLKPFTEEMLLDRVRQLCSRGEA